MEFSTAENIRDAAQINPANPINPKTVFRWIRSDRMLKTAAVEAGKVFKSKSVTASKACVDECRM
jgi:hypothetical protein